MQHVIHKQKSLAIAYDSSMVEALSVDYFNIEFWKSKNALSGKAMGRGSAWFIDAPFGPVVLRQYLRGGWIAKISRRSYAFSTVSRSRPFLEYHFLAFPKGRKPLPLFLISIVVVVTSWWKRYLIVVPSLLHPFLPIQGVPESWHSYFPSLHEWAIVSGTLAMALLIITYYVRFLPVIPINRTAKELKLPGHDESEQI